MREPPDENPPTSWIELIWRIHWPIWWLVVLCVWFCTSHGDLIHVEMKPQ